MAFNNKGTSSCKAGRFARHSRGITPIISVILLLMMTIAIAGLAYSWLQRMQSSIQTASENQSERLIGGLNVGLRIDGYSLECNQSTALQSNVSVHVRNSGTQSAKNLQLYVDESLQSGKSVASLAAGTTYSFNYSNTENCRNWVNLSRKIKVAADEGVATTAFTFRCTTGIC